MRQTKIRKILLDVLRHKDRATARELAFELQVFGIWKSPRELTGFVLADPELKKVLEIEYRTMGGWNRLTFSLKRDYKSILRLP